MFSSRGLDLMPPVHEPLARSIDTLCVPGLASLFTQKSWQLSNGYVAVEVKVGPVLGI